MQEIAGRLAAAGAGDQRSGVGCAEAIIDVDDGNVGRAGVEHAEESGGSGEGGSVSDGGGYCDDGNSDETADYAGERAFHSSADDDGVCFPKFVPDRQQAVQAGYANIVDAGDCSVEKLGRDGSFFGDGKVAGAGAEDGDVAFWLGRNGLTECDGSGLGVVLSGRVGGDDGLGGGGVRACGQDVGSGGSHAREDFRCLDSGLSGGVDDLRKTRAKAAMMIDFSVADVFKWERSEAGGGIFGGEGAAFDFGEERQERGFIHFVLL